MNTFNYINKETENNSIFIIRDFKNKNDCKLEEITIQILIQGKIIHLIILLMNIKIIILIIIL